MTASPPASTLAGLGFTARIARRGTPRPLQAWRRWPIERTHAWINGYGKLRRITDHDATIISFYLYLAAALVTHPPADRARLPRATAGTPGPPPSASNQRFKFSQDRGFMCPGIRTRCRSRTRQRQYATGLRSYLRRDGFGSGIRTQRIRGDRSPPVDSGRQLAGENFLYGFKGALRAPGPGRRRPADSDARREHRPGRGAAARPHGPVPEQGIPPRARRRPPP